MKKISMICSLLLLLLLSACSQDEDQSATQGELPTSQEQPVKEGHQETENKLTYELLMQLDFIPHEVGTTISLIQDERLYHSWAEIFGFKSIPTIDFTKEEVLFVTTYSDGCGRVLENVAKEKDQLVVQLNYPENIRNKKEIVCTEIALPVTFVVKLEKSGLTHGTLKDGNRTLLENELLIQ